MESTYRSEIRLKQLVRGGASILNTVKRAMFTLYGHFTIGLPCSRKECDNDEKGVIERQRLDFELESILAVMHDSHRVDLQVYR
jgi:hypothetical protein